MGHSVFLQAQSLLALALMYVGVLLRRRRTLHARLMSGVVVFDLLVVLQVELARGAVDAALRPASNPLVLNVHVLLSVLYVLVLAPVVLNGRRLLRGDGGRRAAHRRFAVAALVLRTLVAATSPWAAGGA